MHLLQLAGNQAWPNLLPILALKPTSVTFLTSADPNDGYSRSINAIQSACIDLGVRFSLQTLSTRAGNPTTDECRQLLKNLSPDCINLTGGTKPMSIAAYDLARQKNIPAFYLDTRRKNKAVEIVGGPLSQFTSHDAWDLPALVARITVPVALKANGFPVPAHFKTPPDHWVAFSIQAAEIRKDLIADQEIAKAIGALRHVLMGTDSNMPKKAQLRRVLQIPITPPTDSAWHRYLTAAAITGIIQATDNGASNHPEFLLLHEDPLTTDAEPLRSLANDAFKLLEGIWFELALIHRLQQKSSFSDIRWSVEADRLQEPSASSRGETDLVAFNSSQLALHFISCKTTGPHGSSLDHIQGLRQRASKEGGKFSKAELWIFRAKTQDQRRDLESHCIAQNVTLRVFTDPADF